jgi:hypothetical protein
MGWFRRCQCAQRAASLGLGEKVCAKALPLPLTSRDEVGCGEMPLPGVLPQFSVLASLFLAKTSTTTNQPPHAFHHHLIVQLYPALGSASQALSLLGDWARPSSRNVQQLLVLTASSNGDHRSPVAT